MSVANPGEARFFNALFKPELVAVLRVVDPGGCGILILETPYILSFLEEFSGVCFSPATPLVASCYAVLPKVICVCVCTMCNVFIFSVYTSIFCTRGPTGARGNAVIYLAGARPPQWVWRGVTNRGSPANVNPPTPLNTPSSDAGDGGDAAAHPPGSDRPHRIRSRGPRWPVLLVSRCSNLLSPLGRHNQQLKMPQ